MTHPISSPKCNVAVTYHRFRMRRRGHLSHSKRYRALNPLTFLPINITNDCFKALRDGIRDSQGAANLRSFTRFCSIFHANLFRALLPNQRCAMFWIRRAIISFNLRSQSASFCAVSDKLEREGQGSAPFTNSLVLLIYSAVRLDFTISMKISLVILCSKTLTPVSKL